MSLVINTNIPSMQAQRNLYRNTAGLNKSLERLSSGLRINHAADDAAGLQIAETMRAQIRGVSQAISNAQDGTNLLQVAEGTLSVVQDHLQRIRELAVQAANDTNGSEQRAAIQEEIDARVNDIGRITAATEYNGIKLLDGSIASFRIQLGPNASLTLNTISLSAVLGAASLSDLASAGASMAVSSNSAALLALQNVDIAIEAVSSRRATIGALQNRMDAAIENLMVTRENFAASESRIRNVDVANEAANMTKHQILQQAASNILSQANQAPTLALSLLG